MTLQRFLIVNLDRREYIDPETFGTGAGLLEFGTAGSGAMLGLTLLLAAGCRGGPQEPRTDHPLIGSWSENRIAITGDQDQSVFSELARLRLWKLPVGASLYEVAREAYLDISRPLIAVLATEPYEHRALKNRGVRVRASKGE